jgi:hypothetical protein
LIKVRVFGGFSLFKEVMGVNYQHSPEHSIHTSITMPMFQILVAWTQKTQRYILNIIGVILAGLSTFKRLLKRFGMFLYICFYLAYKISLISVTKVFAQSRETILKTEQ